MPIEHEVKVLNIDPQDVERKLIDKGAQKIRSGLTRRYVYDIVPGDRSKWIRLREVDGKATLAVKEITSEAIDGTHEIETQVDDFEAANTLLSVLGFTPKAYQETKRTTFTLAGARLEIDTWPHIPPYLEIESDSTDEVLRVASLLGYNEDDLTTDNTIKIYAGYGIDLNTIRELRF